MTNVIFSRKEFEKHLGKKVDDEVIEKISLFGTPLESIDKDEIEIEIFPNRPDLISMTGYLRGFKSFLGKEIGLKKYNAKPPEKNYSVKVEKDVLDVRPHTVCCVVKGVSFDDKKIKEIIELQEKLHITIGRNRKKVAIGIYPLDKIKFPIRYTAKKPSDIKFQPLGLSKLLNGKQVLQRHPTGKKYSDLLKNAKKFPVFIDSKENILSIPPIINSEDVGRITENTRDVFVECSGFDTEVLGKVLNIVATTLIDMGGMVYQMKILRGGKNNKITPDFSTEKVKLSLKNTNNLLGLSLKEKEVGELLQKMGHGYKKGVVEVPSWRTDVLHEVDLIEDIAIAYGYEKFTSKILNVSTIGEESLNEKIKYKIAEVLIGLRALEISTYHLIKKDELKILKLKNCIEVEDSKTDYKILRPNLLIPCLRILSENKDVDYPQRVFEIGKVFLKDENEETGVKEQERLVFALSSGNFTDGKQYFDYLIRMLKMKYVLEEKEYSFFIDGRSAGILIDGKEIGYLGEVSPFVLRKFGIKMPVVLFEIGLDKILID